MPPTKKRSSLPGIIFVIGALAFFAMLNRQKADNADAPTSLAIIAPTVTPTPGPTPTSTPVPLPTVTPPRAVVNTNAAANLREGPGTDFAVADTIEAGDLLTITGRTSVGDWYLTENGEWIAAFLLESVPAVPTITPVPSATLPPTLSGPLARCVAVPNGKIEVINSGLLRESGTWLDSETAQAVKSRSFSSVYFIAAVILGPGMDDGPWIGIWSSNSLEPDEGIVLGIDGFAHQFSDWPDGSKTDARISQFDDGAQEAKKCTEYMLGIR